MDLLRILATGALLLLFPPLRFALPFFFLTLPLLLFRGRLLRCAVVDGGGSGNGRRAQNCGHDWRGIERRPGL